jgi:hypothetical protein
MPETFTLKNGMRVFSWITGDPHLRRALFTGSFWEPQARSGSPA